MDKAEKYYKENVKNINSKIDLLNKNIDIISWIRLLIVIAGIASGVILYKNSTVYKVVISTILYIIFFIIVMNIHTIKISKREKLNIALDFNKRGLSRKNGEYKSFEDKGNDLCSENHPFASDLDIFGDNSLFQMINTTRTKIGRKKLGEILSIDKLPTKEEIKEKQEAIRELAGKIKWRQNLYINSTFKKSKNEGLDELLEWCKNQGNNTLFKVIVSCVCIGFTFSMIFLCIIGKIPLSYLILNFMINFCIIKLLSRDKNEAIYIFHTMKYNVKAYSNILISIWDEEFESSYLNKLKAKMNNGNNKNCKDEMKKLSNLLDWVGDSAGNAYFFILNILFFADIFILSNLNKWRNTNGSDLEKWLEVMGEFEALNSISNIAFDNESWCYPEISEFSEVKAVDMAHPLIGERAISNSYNLVYPKKITLITGSNMSGKSTFLRTVGVNLVLSYIGSPVCAKSFSCSIMSIYTCMRTKDNLEESISSFYAEILRIKLIIGACKSGQNVFFLLDEIFKGTNSRDRHTGATVLVKQLSENGAVGLLSTHDLELCDLEKSMKAVQNYNFREYYEDDKIKFDYKLRNGKSETQNAVYLMRLAGIEIE